MRLVRQFRQNIETLHEAEAILASFPTMDADVRALNDDEQDRLIEFNAQLRRAAYVCHKAAVAAEQMVEQFIDGEIDTRPTD